jgi:hypothetical protein
MCLHQVRIKAPWDLHVCQQAACGAAGFIFCTFDFMQVNKHFTESHAASRKESIYPK